MLSIAAITVHCHCSRSCARLQAMSRPVLRALKFFAMVPVHYCLVRPGGRLLRLSNHDAVHVLFLSSDGLPSCPAVYHDFNTLFIAMFQVAMFVNQEIWYKGGRTLRSRNWWDLVGRCQLWRWWNVAVQLSTCWMGCSQLWTQRRRVCRMR